MVWVAGVDGCRRGWFRACRETRSGELAFDVVESVAALLEKAPRPKVAALDMPIGLPASGPRECDREARLLLGPRRSSVFLPPVRAALRARTWEQACRIGERVDGRRLSLQAWGLVPKIREVDEAIAACPAARKTIREVHPEVSFWAWNGKRPMRWNKKKRQGRGERLALAEEWLGRGVLSRARGGFLKKDVADDDILDAIATLWTAHRIARGKARTLPASPPRDERALPMEIVF